MEEEDKLRLTLCDTVLCGRIRGAETTLFMSCSETVSQATEWQEIIKKMPAAICYCLSIILYGNVLTQKVPAATGGWGDFSATIKSPQKQHMFT